MAETTQSSSQDDVGKKARDELARLANGVVVTRGRLAFSAPVRVQSILHLAFETGSTCLHPHAKGEKLGVIVLTR